MKASALLTDLMFDVKNIRRTGQYRALYTEFHGICDFPFHPSFTLPGGEMTRSQYNCLRAPGSEPGQTELRYFHDVLIVHASSGQRLVDPRDLAPFE